MQSNDVTSLHAVHMFAQRQRQETSIIRYFRLLQEMGIADLGQSAHMLSRDQEDYSGIIRYVNFMREMSDMDNFCVVKLMHLLVWLYEYKRKRPVNYTNDLHRGVFLSGHNPAFYGNHEPMGAGYITTSSRVYAMDDGLRDEFVEFVKDYTEELSGVYDCTTVCYPGKVQVDILYCRSPNVSDILSANTLMDYIADQFSLECQPSDVRYEDEVSGYKNILYQEYADFCSSLSKKKDLVGHDKQQQEMLLARKKDLQAELNRESREEFLVMLKSQYEMTSMHLELLDRKKSSTNDAYVAFCDGKNNLCWQKYEDALLDVQLIQLGLCSKMPYENAIPRVLHDVNIEFMKKTMELFLESRSFLTPKQSESFKTIPKDHETISKLLNQYRRNRRVKKTASFNAAGVGTTTFCCVPFSP
ncbi:MAG: hypothetical protein VXZ73_04615 [Pseudomonadota bacterium]|nr:hypothetical protein [Pseudomonadota bacterium]